MDTTTSSRLPQGASIRLDDFKLRYQKVCRELTLEAVDAIMMLEESSAEHRLSLTHRAIGEKVCLGRILFDGG